MGKSGPRRAKISYLGCAITCPLTHCHFLSYTNSKIPYTIYLVDQPCSRLLCILCRERSMIEWPA